MAAQRPRWLITGGMGMIGRNLVKYLIDNNLASEIRVADKRVPFMAFMNADHRAAMEHPIVEVVQADISDEEHLDRVLAEPLSGGAFFDYVVNLAAETAHGKSDEMYAKMVDGAARLGAGAARLGSGGVLKKFVHVSTAFVYKSDRSRPAREADGSIAPWTQQAEYMLRSEDALRALGAALPLVVLRPAIVYGPGDVAGLMPRVVIAAAYVKMKDKMELLWDGDLKINTVHVYDVARAIYWAARKAEPGAVFNLADKGDSDAGRVSAALGRIFSIETGFLGSMMSNIAKVRGVGWQDNNNY